MKTILTFGVFDLLHYGHFELFRKLKEKVGDEGKVVIALQLDEWVSKFKDVNLVYNFEMRKSMIENIKYVDSVIPYDTVGVDAVKNISFDILAVGPEHTSERFQKLFAWCRENGKEVVVIPRTDGISTTRLKAIIKDL